MSDDEEAYAGEKKATREAAKRNASDSYWESKRTQNFCRRDMRITKERQTHERAIKPREKKINRVAKRKENNSEHRCVLENPFKHHERYMQSLSTKEEREDHVRLFSIWIGMRGEAMARASDKDEIVECVPKEEEMRTSMLRYVSQAKVINPRKEVEKRYEEIYHKQLLQRAPVSEWGQADEQAQLMQQHVRRGPTLPGRLNQEDHACHACGCTEFAENPDTVSLSCKRCAAVKKNCIQPFASFAELDGCELIRKTAPYKRDTHCRERRERLEGSENKNIPSEVLEKILLQLKVRQIDPVNNHKAVTYKVIRSILKETGYASFYANIVKIINILTSRNCVEKFTEDEKTQLMLLFQESQEPYNYFKKQGSKNYLSYSYALRKLCFMAGFDRFLPFLNEYESRANLQDAENVWRQICQYNREKGLNHWMFYPSN